jgi:hypothetical protein
VYTNTAETSKEPEVLKRLCETYMVLGEVSLENENYPQAVEDLSICLQRRTESLAEDSRLAFPRLYYKIRQNFFTFGLITHPCKTRID